MDNPYCLLFLKHFLFIIEMNLTLTLIYATKMYSSR